MGDELRFDHRTPCLIRVKGALDPKWSEWFEGFTLTAVDDDTLLTGAVVDQAALEGVIAKLCNLGLTLRTVIYQETKDSEE